MINEFYELILACGCRYYFDDVENLRLFLRFEYGQPYMIDRTGGYVWSDQEIETATKCGKLVLVWPTREAFEVRNESFVGIVRRAPKKTSAILRQVRRAARNDERNEDGSS